MLFYINIANWLRGPFIFWTKSFITAATILNFFINNKTGFKKFFLICHTENELFIYNDESIPLEILIQP